ncbi:hypothetical protein H3N56_11190 [Cetobacterium sp. 2A]|uniref:hypothetical protein n=1 Tax=Cetobacterium sp. 2A TaxID=2754723 RepID=UPI00163C2E19|nr:hypothetical protein [Cetobacterium sp. 2A]MBC2856997.1 hypothetical protein [Cetobacterium sp. 2A]
MKKTLLLFILIFSFGMGVESPNEVMEERIESELEYILKTKTKIEYDVNISGESINIEVEIDSLKAPNKEELENLSKKIISYLKTETKYKDINITIKKDSVILDDEVIYIKREKI